MPENQILWPIIAGVLIVVANAFFVLVEYAIVTVRRGQMGRLAEEGNADAQRVMRMLKDPERAIAGSQVGVTVASILLGIVAEEPLLHLLEPGLTRVLGRVPWLAGLAAGVATIVVLLVLSYFQMVFGELTPKTIALRFPARVALLVSRPMQLFATVTSPLVWLVDHSAALVLRVLGVGGEAAPHGIHTVDELKDVVRESQQGGLISSGDEGMLLRVMDFAGRHVREAMIPRPDIVAVEKNATLRELLDTFKESRHSRFPVYEDNLDSIVGVVAMKEVLPLFADDPSAAGRRLAELDLIRPALVVPESRRIGGLFNQMRRERRHMAIVIDEYGGTSGLVTTEELAEEVVGRLTDEWVTEAPPLTTLEGGAYEIDAQTRVDEVNAALKLSLPLSPDYDTIAGFVLFTIRRIPKVGEVITLDDLRLRVVQMAGPKIERVRIERAK